MEFALVVRELTKYRRMLALGVLVATIAAVLSVYRLDGLKLKPRGLVYSSASTTVMVDSTPSSLGSTSQSFEGLTSRATVYANFMTSPTFLKLVGQRAGVAGDQIYAAGPTDPQMPRVVQEPTAVQRNVEITGETTPYRFNFNNDPNIPTIQIYAQAPTTSVAIRLANAAAASLRQYVRTVQAEQQISRGLDVSIRPLGEATGGVSDPGIKKSLAVLAFVGVLLLWCVLILVVTRFRESWRATGVLAEVWKPQTEDPARTEEPPGVHRAYEYENADHTNGNGHGGDGERVPDAVGSAHVHAP
jgi:hypothetical protein